jgi:hypothetical protein
MSVSRPCLRALLLRSASAPWELVLPSIVLRNASLEDNDFDLRCQQNHFGVTVADTLISDSF